MISIAQLRSMTNQTRSAGKHLQDALDRLLVDKSQLTVLDVGCGAKCHFTFNQNVHVVGVDPSDRQLTLNARLDERICGSIEAVDFPESKFDVIIFFDVLEHIENPNAILRKCCRWLVEGGLLVIASPRVLTPEGLITKFTPHSFHEFIYRTVLKYDGASMKGLEPFPAYLRLSILPSRLKKTCGHIGMKVEYESIYNRRRVEDMRKASSILADAYTCILVCLNAVTLNLWKPHLSSFHLILKREQM